MGELRIWGYSGQCRILSQGLSVYRILKISSKFLKRSRYNLLIVTKSQCDLNSQMGIKYL